MSLLAPLTLIILVVVVASNLILSFVVYKNDRKSATNRIFSLLNLVVSAWLVVMYLSLHEQANTQLNLLLIRLSIFLATPMSSLFFLFANTLPSKVLRISRAKLILLATATLLVMLISVSPFAFTGIEFVNGSPNPLPGPGMAPFGLFTISLSVAAVVALFRKFRTTSGVEKRQLNFFILGVLLMLGLITVTVFGPVVFFKDNSFVSLVPIYTLIFTGLTTLAIVRHGLFDIKIILTEAVTVILWIILFAKIFVSQSLPEAIVDILVFSVIVVFGILLIRSVIREIEQRKILEDLTERLKQLDAQKDEFISMAAHELRAPMTAIKGYVSMVLEGDTGDIPEKARGFLADANNINDRLIRLVNNMLNVSRIEEGRMVYQEEVESLSRVLRSVFNQFIPEAQRKNLEYTLEIPPQVKDSVKVDPDRVQEIIGNLVSNAIKYTDTGSVKVKLSQSEPNTVRCEVIDTGPGISDEEQKQLFQKFRRAESSVGKTTGTGLGLYISRLLVEKFGGKIGLTSKPGSGSNFWFELPLA